MLQVYTTAVLTVQLQPLHVARHLHPTPGRIKMLPQIIFLRCLFLDHQS